MNNTVNFSGFADLYAEMDDEFDSYGTVDINSDIESIYQSVQSYHSEFNELQYCYED